MASATDSNTGHKELDYRLALAMAGSRRAIALLALSKNRAFTTLVSGTVVPAGPIVAATVTPKFTGKFKVSWFSSWAAPGGGVVTPQITAAQGLSTTVPAVASQTGTVQADWGGSMEVDGFTLGVPVTFTLTTSGGDASITIGQGASAPGAGILVQELS